MVSRVLVVALSASLVAAAAAAPLTHLHDDHHATEHHRSQAVHAHFSGHEIPTAGADEAEIHGEDTERVVYLDVFVAVAGTFVSVPAVVVGTFQLAASSESTGHVSVAIVHGHDPPAVTCLPARAPPTSLS